MSAYLDVTMQQVRHAKLDADLHGLRQLTADEITRRHGDVESVLRDLEELRPVARQRGEEVEDAILDLMDYVTGWCSPQMKIRQ